MTSIFYMAVSAFYVHLKIKMIQLHLGKRVYNTS